MTAEAKGTEAKASAIEKTGLAEAAVVRERGASEASVIREKGGAEAQVIEGKLKGEAAGLAEKAVSIKALDEASRVHEEFRLQLAKDKDVELAALEQNRMVAEAQAQAMSEAFKQANIDIVGGDGQFFDRMVQAITMGKSADRVVQHSTTASNLLGEYIDGRRSLPADLTNVLSNPSVSSSDIKDLTVAALLGRWAAGAKGKDKEAVAKLLETARELGLADRPVG